MQNCIIVLGHLTHTGTAIKILESIEKYSKILTDGQALYEHLNAKRVIYELTHVGGSRLAEASSPPPTLSEYDADEAAAATSSRDDVTADGKFGRRRRHLLRILLVLAQCCYGGGEKDMEAPATYQKNSSNAEHVVS